MTVCPSEMTQMEFHATPTPSVVPTPRERFEAFNAANPEVYGMLIEMALRLKRAGMRRYGIGALFEVLRYRSDVETASADSFKLNNDLRAFYARKIMDEVVELDGFFRTRESVASVA